MTVQTIDDVAFGFELEAFEPDTSLAVTSEFASAVGWGDGGGRFTDHALAREQGLPGALVPGLLTLGFLTSMIHRWAPTGRVASVDTVFRAPILAEAPVELTAVVTDVDEETGAVELDLSAKNDRGETGVFGTATVMLPLQ
jgi:acyl dehydratase